MSNLDKIKIPVQHELNEFENIFKSHLKSDVPLLNTIINYIIRRKGKQFRPLLVFLSAKLHGSTNNNTDIAATLIEILHTATLIHDDIVDETFERRSVFSINALWKTKGAVLIGDYLLSQGMIIALKNNCYDLLRTVSEAVKDMSEGELLQVKAARKLDISKETYFEIIRKKTAVLIAACTKAGTQTVTNDESILKQMFLFGEYLGIAFQIKDDIFDFQKKGILGKPTGNDLIEKKITLPLILAMENASSNDKNKILHLLGKQTDIQKIISFIHEKNGINKAIDSMNEYKNLAINILSAFPDNQAKNSLIELVNFTINREQ